MQLASARHSVDFKSTRAATPADLISVILSLSSLSSIAAALFEDPNHERHWDSRKSRSRHTTRTGRHRRRVAGHGCHDSDDRYSTGDEALSEEVTHC